MSDKKPIRSRGKIQLGRYFQRFKEGDKVAVREERSIPKAFPKRLQGRTGIVEEKRGKAYAVKIRDQTKEKTFLIEAVHLKKIKN
jgi:ribosomal protein L21E